MPAQSTHYTTTRTLNAALTADWPPSTESKIVDRDGIVRPFTILVAGSIAALNVVDAGGQTHNLTNVSAGMVTIGLDAPVLFSRILQTSTDFDATNYVVVGFPNWRA